MSKAQGSPFLKIGIVALAVLAAVFFYARMTGGSENEELGAVPPPKYDPVSPLDPQNVIGGGSPGGPTPVKK
ncbi:MAG: hypothetical protein ABIV13_04655 [Fimbriimonadales bacterium]